MNKYLMENLFKHSVFNIVQLFLFEIIPLLSNNAVFCSLRIKDVFKKYHKGIHSTDRDKLLNINFKRTVVCKKCCWIDQIVPSPPTKNLKI